MLCSHNNLAIAIIFRFSTNKRAYGFFGKFFNLEIIVHRRTAIVYIAGYGRSGSTILSLLLSQIDRVISLGEVCNLRLETFEKDRCSCGAVYSQCEFWGEYRPNQPHSDPISFAARQTRAKYIIDSSKTAYRNAFRPWLLKWAGWNVLVIHLNREANSVVDSAKKGRNTRLESGIIERRKFEALRTHIGRFVANLSARLFHLFRLGPYLSISYEELQTDFNRTMCNIGDFLDIDINFVLEKVINKQPLEIGHEVSGNRLLRRGPVFFELGEGGST